MELTFLRPLYEQPGPWVSVYLDATRSVENAEREVELRWRAQRDVLARQGADPGTLDAVASAIEDQPTQPGPYGLVVLARAGDGAAGDVAWVEPLPAPPAADEALFGPLPHVLPLITQRGEQVPYVRVLADRTGADVVGLTAGGSPRRRQAEGGETFPIRKVQVGGWSQPRYQRAAEETWKRNAGDAAAAVVDLAESVGAEVVVVGGDVRAVQLLADQLPKRWQDRLVRTEAGSRAPGADEAAFDDVTIQAIADVAERHVREVVDRFQSQLAGGVASNGLPDVVRHLQRGQVEAVLLVNHPESRDTLWIHPDDPTSVGVNRSAENPVRVRADAALARAIAATDAQLVLVGRGDATLRHGVGATLRFPDIT